MRFREIALDSLQDVTTSTQRCPVPLGCPAPNDSYLPWSLVPRLVHAILKSVYGLGGMTINGRLGQEEYPGPINPDTSGMRRANSPQGWTVRLRSWSRNSNL